MDQHSGIIKELTQILGAEAVLGGSAVRKVYSSDAYTVEKYPPTAVVLPKTREQVSQVIQICNKFNVPFTPRGAGTGLSGGAMPALGGIVISTKKLCRIIDYNISEQWMHAECGIANIKLTEAVQPHGYHFAPDPSSQTVATLGGNVAMNSGGPHTLKYGVTAQHILGVCIVLSNGETVELGGPAGGDEDLLSLVVGSEGTLGVVTDAWVRLTPNPKEVATATICFDSITQASGCVSAFVRSGILPAALEMMDAHVLFAVNQSFPLDYPETTKALLLVETDGETLVARNDLNELIELSKNFMPTQIKIAETADERKHLWLARKKGVGALGRLAPTVVTHDGVIPPSRLPEMLKAVYEIASEQNLGVANIFHAGDGNLHPIFYFDEREEGAIDRVVKAGEMIIEKCLEFGGSVTGEHGIGIEKVDLLAKMFSQDSLIAHASVKDIFLATQSCNPCKVIPNAKGCLEHKMRWRGAST